MKWYGSVQNRLEENKQLCEEIKVGEGMTKYNWSDRYAYEVIEVISQKHVIVRELSHKCVGGPYSNEWELYSDKSNPTMELVKRGKYWYRVYCEGQMRERVNVSFGVADYYYDYEF